MDNYFIQPATQNDFPAIRALIHAVHINPTGLNWQRFMVARSYDGEILGCGQIKRHTDGSLELASIAVREQDRGRGIARAVIERLLAGEDQRPLYLICRARLGILYERFGFRKIYFIEVPKYFQRLSRIERLINQASAEEDRLLIMRLD